jgi:hypothetical protein
MNYQLYKMFGIMLENRTFKAKNNFSEKILF